MPLFFRSLFRKARQRQRSAKAVLMIGRKVLLLLQEDGKWDLPGGKVKHGEDITKGLMREVHEETGLTIDPQLFLTKTNGPRPDKPDQMVFSFLCFAKKKHFRENMRVSGEHLDYQLVPISQARDLRMQPHHRRAIIKAGRQLRRLESFG